MSPQRAKMENPSKSVAVSFIAGVAGYVVAFVIVAMLYAFSSIAEASGWGAVAGAAMSPLPIGVAIVAFLWTLLRGNSRKPKRSQQLGTGRGNQVPRVRFSRVLPIVQFALAVVLTWLARMTPPVPRGFDTLFVSTLEMVCSGINAPAFLFSGIMMIAGDALLPLYRVDDPPISIFGVGVQELIFLGGVVVTWYLVGQALDRSRLPKASKAMTWVGVLRNVLLLLAGSLLLFFALRVLQDLWRFSFNNRTGAIVRGILMLVWALALLVFPSVRLVRGLRAAVVQR